MNVFSKTGIFLVLSVCALIFGTITSASAAPKLLSPIAGSTLPGNTATFTWTANGESLTDWSLRIGTKQGDSSLYNSGNLPSGTLAQTASGISTNGTTVWVRLQWRYTNGLWSSTDVQYTTGTGSGSTTSSSSSPTTTTTTTTTATASTTSNNGSGRPALLTPSAGSTLPGSTATFTWTANGAALTDWSLRIGTKQGDSSLYNSGNLPSGTLAQTASGISTNGTTVWVRLQWRYTNGAWSSTDVQYTTGAGSGSTTSSSPSPTSSSSSSTPTIASASTTSNNGSGRPALLTPSAGSTLPGSTASFTWTANGAALTDWSLRIGTKQGDSSLYNSGNLPSGTLARTASGIPTNGTTVWVRLQWRYTNGAWSSTDVQYTTGAGSGSTTSSSSSPTTTTTTTTTSTATASTTSNDGSGRPALLTPSAGSTLPGSTATFTWTANGAALTDWSLRVGLSAGDSDVYNSGNLSSGTLARTVSGLPTNGFPVWVRLQWRYTDGSWSSTDVQYKGGTGTGGTSPSNPSPTPSTPTAPSPSTPSPSGSVFYVSTSGNDANPGTQSSPLRTIKRGLGVLKAGNTLFIRGGTYSEILQTHTGTKFPVGTSWNTPVTVAAYTGETVILRGAIDIGIASPPTQYVIFDGINIDATNEESGLALTGGSHHIRFQNFEIKNPQVNGIQLTWHNGGSTYNEFRNCHIHDTGKSGKGHGIYIETSNNLIDGCDLHDNYRYGLQIYDGYNQASNFNIIRNNHVHQNGLLQAHSGGITIGGDGNLIENNRVHDNPWGISVLSGSPRNTKVRNNTVWNHPGAGVVVGGINTTLENNTAYNNSPDYQYP
jgi:parallel beta-helix repeat protein